jgi:hypothetical protein
MSALQIEAIRKLPESYVINGTETMMANTPKGDVVIVLCPYEKPMIYRNGNWHPFKE